MKDFGMGKVLLTFALLGSVSLQAEEAYDVKWVQHFETADTWDTGLSIATDSNDNLLVASKNGNYINGLYESFVNKFSNDGELLWSKKILNPNYSLDYSYADIAVDKNDNVYITGSTPYPDQDVFIMKYDTNGTLIWDKRCSSLGAQVYTRVTNDNRGNVFVSGTTLGSFNGEQVIGEGDGFIAKYNSDGILLWNKQFGTSKNETAFDINTDSSGNVYATGWTDGVFDGEVSVGYSDAFLVKYSNDGTLIWNRQFGTPGSEVRFHSTVDNNDNIVISGWTNGTFNGENTLNYPDLFIVKYDSNGSQLWNTLFGPLSYRYVDIESISTDNYDNIFTTGWIEDGVFDGETSKGGGDIFITKHGSNGTFLWAKQLGSSEWDDAVSITADKKNNIFVTGYTEGTIEGAVNYGMGSGYIMKLSSSNTAPVTIATATPQAVILNGTTVTLDASQSYDIDADNITYAWGWINKPLNSTATLSHINSINPTFIPDIKGNYTLYLDVTDTSDVSTRVEIVVSFDNIQPVADTGTYAPIAVGNSVTLDASASSDANADSLTYSWSLVSQPVRSTVSISNSQNVQALLTGDVKGTYEISLIVNDGTVDSDPVNTIIEVIRTRARMKKSR